MKRKTLNEIYSEAKEKLPDAKTYPGKQCTIPVNDGAGGCVNVIFEKYDQANPWGWRPKSSNY